MPGPLVSAALIQGGATIANNLLDRSAAAQNQKYNRENMRENFAYSQQAQRMAAVNEVAGLKMAGLSPSLANGAAAAPIANSSNGTAQASHFDPANLLLMAQLKNVQADTEKKEQETTNLETVNESNSLALTHAKDLDATLSLNMPVLFTEMSKDSRYSEGMREMFAAAAKDIKAEGITQGGLQGLEKYLNLRVEQKEALIKEMTTRFDWNLAIAKLEDPHLIKSLVKMPQTERENLLALSGKYIQEVATLAQTAETEVSKREKIGAEIQKLTRETQKILHSDNAQMYKEKDAQGLLWSLAGSLGQASVEIGTAGMKAMR